MKEFPHMEQDANEFATLLAIVASIAPLSILEIGVFMGGTLARLSHACPYATVIGIDPNPMVDVWDERNWGPLRLVRGASQSHDDMQRAMSLNHGRPFDFVHIDGDHTYDNAKSDWEWARDNGARLVAIHDVKSSGNPSIECKRLWEEEVLPWSERNAALTKTINGTGDGVYGIGVVWLRRAA